MGMMTLVEYAKGLEMSPTRAMVEQFAASSDIFGALPIEGLSAGASIYEGLRQTELPSGLGFRAINEASTTGAGKLSPFSEPSFVFDHDIDIDRAIIDRYGMDRMNQHVGMGIAAAGKMWTDTFLTGDNSTQNRQFDGLARRCARFSNRVLTNSAASGGAALSLYNLDRALANTKSATHIIASWNLMPRFIQAARNTSLSGFVLQTWDGVGMPKMSYAGRPILWGYEQDLHGVILPFSEVGSGGGSAVTTSIYVVGFGDMGLRGIQLKPLAPTGPKLLENEITYRAHLSWDTGLVDEHQYCMTRLTSITDAAFVA
jgi:hypothetical protein